ncbi:unnamed protein product [Thlaspi arvense]|uniref:MATH domain-containing protein n=1 Tax=Thlaspi arvense TaxID=13288 RepID=A0AAU9SCU5_THLAR|nr:unnamed protein product [Thlaspi arvense]
MRETQHWFNDKEDDWGFTSMLPLYEPEDKDGGFLVNGNVKIVAEVDVLEVVGKLDVSEETLSVKESIDVNEFQVLPSQVEFVNRLFERYSDIASKFRPKNPHLKTAYMNVLLSLTMMIRQSPENLSKDDLVDAYAALGSLGWLEKKLDELSEKKGKEEACEKCSDLETLLDKEKAELLAARAPLLYDDFFLDDLSS